MIRQISKLFGLRNRTFVNYRSVYSLCKEQQAKPVFVQPWNVTKREYVELVDAIGSAHNCYMIGEVMKENLNILCDYQLSYALYHIWNHELVLDEHFYGVISPIVKYYVEHFDRENSKSLIEITKYCGLMDVQDQELWKLLNNKINNEKLYRYIELEDLCEITHSLANCQQGTQEFYNYVENYVIKHKLALNENMTKMVLNAFNKVGSSQGQKLKLALSGNLSEEELKLKQKQIQ